MSIANTTQSMSRLLSLKEDKKQLKRELESNMEKSSYLSSKMDRLVRDRNDLKAAMAHCEELLQRRARMSTQVEHSRPGAALPRSVDHQEVEVGEAKVHTASADTNSEGEASLLVLRSKLCIGRW